MQWEAVNQCTTEGEHGIAHIHYTPIAGCIDLMACTCPPNRPFWKHFGNGWKRIGNGWKRPKGRRGGGRGGHVTRGMHVGNRMETFWKHFGNGMETDGNGWKQNGNGWKRNGNGMETDGNRMETDGNGMETFWKHLETFGNIFE